MARWNISDPDHIFVDSKRTDVLFEALGRGAGSHLIGQSPFSLKDAAINIPIERFNGDKDIITKNRQSSDWTELWDDPFFLPYTLCISSSPSEVMGHMAAMRLFLRAIAKTKSEKRAGIPKWHTLYGGYTDKLRNADVKSDINLLVISNIASNSTDLKIEKLRDIMAMYSDIPKVLVMANENPMDFMMDKLHMPVNMALWLGEKRKPKTNNL